MLTPRAISGRDARPILAAAALGAALGGLTLFGLGLPVRFAALFFLALAVPSAAIATGNVTRFVVCLLLADVVLNVDIHLMYRPGVIGNPNGWVLSLTTICLVVLYAMWLGEGTTNRRARPRFFPEISLPALCLIAAAALSLVNSREPTYSLFEIKQLLELFLLYFYVANYVANRGDLKSILLVVVLGLAFESGVMFVQYATRNNFSLLLKEVSPALLEQSPFRAAGTFDGPNPTAGYLAPTLLLVLSQLLARARLARVPAATLIFVAGLASLLITFSRGGWVAFLGGLGILLLLNLRYQLLRISLPVMAGGIAVAVLLATALGAGVVGRLTSDYQTALARLPLIQLSLAMVAAHPFVGVGANTFGLVMDNYVTMDTVGSWLYTVHNKYLDVWAETGTFGLLAFLWFLASLFRGGLRCLRSGPPPYSALALGLVVALAAYCIHMLFDVFDQRGLVQVLWVTAGLVAGLDVLCRQARREPRAVVELAARGRSPDRGAGREA